MHRLFALEPFEKATRFRFSRGRIYKDARDDGGATLLQHSCSKSRFYAAKITELVRADSD
jgi:hypothetical protein